MEAMEAMGGEAPPCYCWATHSGAELDLLIVRGRRRRGFEIKRTVAPRVTGSMRSALQVLRLDSLHVIRTGQATFPLAERIRAVSVTGLLNEIEPLAPGPGTPPTLRLAPALASRRSNRVTLSDKPRRTTRRQKIWMVPLTPGHADRYILGGICKTRYP